jgi:hypothetical protein
MCHVPSWITTKDGTVLFLTDRDVKKHDLDLYNATGHTAIRDIFNCDGKEGEGLNKKTPQVVKDAFAAGKFNKLASQGDIIIDGGEWTIPIVEVGEDIEIKGKAKVKAPRLKTIGNELLITKGSSLEAPLLKEVDYPNVYGKLIAPKLMSR